jgi:hypothetical protein
MRCIACNTNLNDFESTRKYENGEFVDMCEHCFRSSDMQNIAVIERHDLATCDDLPDDIMEEL